MQRVRLVLAIAVGLIAASGVPAVEADPAGGGSQRWTASYDAGSVAFTADLALSPDGSSVVQTGLSAFGSRGHIATLAYGASNGSLRWAAEYPADPDQYATGFTVAVSPDGSRAYVGGYTDCQRNCDASSFEGWVTIAYDVATGQRLWVARQAAQGGGPNDIAVSPDGTRVVVNGTDGSDVATLLAYDAETGDLVWSSQVPKEGGWYGGGVVVSPDGATAYSTTAAPGGNPLACGTGGYQTTAYSMADGSVRWNQTFQQGTSGLCGAPTDLALSSDGLTLYVTGYGGRGAYPLTFQAGVVAYDTSDGHQKWGISDPDISPEDGETPVSVGLAPDGSRLYISTDDHCNQVETCTWRTAAYDAATGDRLWLSTYDGGGPAFEGDMAVSPDGSSIYLTGQLSYACYSDCPATTMSAPLVAYDASTGAERWVTSYPGDIGTAVAVSPDSSSVYLAGTFAASSSAAGRTAGASSGRATTCASGRCGYSTASYRTKSGPGRFEDDNTALSYDSWHGAYDKDAVGGAWRISDRRGARATFKTPTSTSLTLLTREGPGAGRVRILVDGQARGTYDLYAAEAGPRAVTVTGLSKRMHTMTAVVLGRHAAAADGSAVVIDGVRYHNDHGLIEESSSRVRYDRWFPASLDRASGGSLRKSGSRTGSVSMEFRGRRVTWVTATGPSFGRARVRIDGRSHVVDLYRSITHWRASFSFRHLGPGTHHLTVRVLGRKDRASSATTVVVDALVVHRH